MLEFIGIMKNLIQQLVPLSPWLFYNWEIIVSIENSEIWDAVWRIDLEKCPLMEFNEI